MGCYSVLSVRPSFSKWPPGGIRSHEKEFAEQAPPLFIVDSRTGRNYGQSAQTWSSSWILLGWPVGCKHSVVPTIPLLLHSVSPGIQGPAVWHF